MKVYFENGLTVINTESMGGHINKHGHHGVSYNPSTKYYTSSITFKYKTYYIGASRNVDEAIAMRKEADKHRDNDTFLEWYYTERKQRRKRK